MLHLTSFAMGMIAGASVAGITLIAFFLLLLVIRERNDDDA